MKHKNLLDSETPICGSSILKVKWSFFSTEKLRINCICEQFVCLEIPKMAYFPDKSDLEAHN